jgi:alkanesulfonate monooxygenase SsuD/methylene tetrahydromethanopterin reductase-like flavin-dependent oxidoreductase (luciferase family)
MPGSTGAGLADEDKAIVAEVGRRYDSNLHLVNSADHTAPLEPRFVDRFAVVGPPDACADRILALRDLGIHRVVLTGGGFGADPDGARTAHHLTVEELLPALQA